MATLKQKKALKKIVENHGNISKAMIAAGYSEASAKNPKNLTDSKGWNELMEEYLPDTLLGQKHNELLNIPIKKRRYVKGELVDEVEELDSQAVSKGLDMAYKLKGKYAPEKKDITTNGESINMSEDKIKAINDLALDD